MKLLMSVAGLEAGAAILKFPDGSSVSWPLGALPPGLKTGSTLNFIISGNGAGVGDAGLAKTLLNEIINADD